MPDVTHPNSSSPPSITSSPSIFAYQTRLLTRTASKNAGSSQSLAGMAASPPSSHPSSPMSGARIGRMGSISHSPGFNNLTKDIGMESRIGLGLGGRPVGNHGRGSKSVDLVRGQWEAKIDAAGNENGSPISSPKSRNGYTPPTQSPSSFAVTPMTPASVSRGSTAFSPLSQSSSSIPSTVLPTQSESPTSIQSTFEMTAGTPSSTYQSPYMAQRAAKRATISGMAGYEPPLIPDNTGSTISSTQTSSIVSPQSNIDQYEPRARPASISSYSSVMSPNTTGDSSATAGKKSHAERIAEARANALRRREAKEKAAGISAEVGQNPEPAKEATNTLTSLFTPPSVSSSSFTPPHRASDESSAKEPLDTTPSIVTHKASANPPVAFSPASQADLLLPAPKDKYGSLSKSDRRKLGRHLPRIASGDSGWGEEDNIPVNGHSRMTSGTRKSSLGRNSGLSALEDIHDSPIKPPGKAKENTAPASSYVKTQTIKKVKSTDILTSSTSLNRIPASPKTPNYASTPVKRRSVYAPLTPKGGLGPIGAASPRPTVAGEEMKGLMSSVGGTARGAAIDDEGVTGMSNRLRLSRLPLPSTSAAMAPAPLPSRRLQNSNWMDRQRHDLAAYEYLCHVGEAQQWIEGCLEEDLAFGVTEMEEGLRDGVVLAKLARVYEGEEVVKRIWTEAKHRFRQSDNINYFLSFVRNVGLPETFIFELTDLYDKKNIPKVIYCIHVLSHLLARLGRAERIGNLIGQFEFTDEQLAATQKGLQGVAMPNFGAVGTALAKETNWEPEEEPETEDERRDRELLECERSIIGLQRFIRGKQARMRRSRTHAELAIAEPIITRFQARARGAVCRRYLKEECDERTKLGSWTVKLQAASRSHVAKQDLSHKIEQVRSSGNGVTPLQAQARGVLARIRKDTVQNNLDVCHRSIVALQSVCRGCLARRGRIAHQKTLVQPQVIGSVSTFQALARGKLQRQAAAKQKKIVEAHQATFTLLQSHLRGALVRRNRQAQEEKMGDATDIIVSIQAVARGHLTRRKKQALTNILGQSSTSVSMLQAQIRGKLAKRNHDSMRKALATVQVAGNIGGLQAFLRSKLAKKSTTEQKKQLEFVQPDVIGFQAVARGYLQRRDYRDWRDYLVKDPHTKGALIFLQSLIRGFLARRRLYSRVSYIHRNIDKVVKIQAIWRGRTQRQMYDKLITGEHVDVPTIQNYMHLLDDTEGDFRDIIRIEQLRKSVVELIRENQTLEIDVQELDTKIALILKNKMSFEDLARAKRRTGKEEDLVVSGNNDPFSSGAHLDRTSQRKLELYEHLFFTLQTKPEYLAKVLKILAKDESGSSDKDRKMVESVTLILFAFGHERREEYLFHKLLQMAVHDEILYSDSLATLAEARFPIVPLAAQYIRPTLTTYLQDVLSEHVIRVVEAPNLDLCTDPVEIYHRLINAEESYTGVPSALPRDLDADQVLQTDINARAQYIQHLQELRALTSFIIAALIHSTAYMPYTVRMLAREAFLALRIKYPEASDEELAPIVGRTVLLPLILPALIAPEQYGLTPQAIGSSERRNLAIIANLITHVAAQDFTKSDKDRLVRVPLAEYIRAEGKPFIEWIIEVAGVDHPEAFYQAHDLLSSFEAKPITVTRSEIYGVQSILMRNLSSISKKKGDDPMARVLQELEGPPVDYDRGKQTVNLRLHNRLAELQVADPRAIEKADWVQAKRHVLAVLRVQSGRTLVDVLVSRPDELHEQLWIQEVHRDIALEQARMARHNLPPTPVEAEYHIESIRSLPFHEVKSRAIEFCMKLERSGKLSRKDDFQDLLISIASDIIQKHQLRQDRTKNLIAMTEAFGHSTEKKKSFEDQIKYYHDYIDSAMAALQQKGKKKPSFLSKQYRHQLGEARSGRKSKFGSYKYTASELYEKKILLSVHQVSPRQFDKIHLVISSNEVGVFTLEMTSPTSSGNPTMGHEELRMEDLLQAQFDNNVRLDLFEGLAAFNLNMLIHQINKKFYAS